MFACYSWLISWRRDFEPSLVRVSRVPLSYTRTAAASPVHGITGSGGLDSETCRDPKQGALLKENSIFFLLSSLFPQVMPNRTASDSVFGRCGFLVWALSTARPGVLRHIAGSFASRSATSSAGNCESSTGDGSIVC